MTDLERFLSNRNADADTWVDTEGLHVHDWETDRCLLFDANESDYHFICIYIHALRTLSVFGACLAEITTENIHLEGNQQFLLDWLLERLRIIMASDGERQREHIIKFFDVWSEIYGLFWW